MAGFFWGKPTSRVTQLDWLAATSAVSIILSQTTEYFAMNTEDLFHDLFELGIVVIGISR